MDAHQRQVGALLRLVAQAGTPLTRRDGLWATPFRPAGRKHTRPWAVGADVAELALVVLADDGEAGRFPLAGSTLSEAATVLVETVWVHVGVDLQLPEITDDLRFVAVPPAALVTLDTALDDAGVAALIEAR